MPLKDKEKIIVSRLLYLACLVVLEYNNKDKIRYVRVMCFSLIGLKSME